MLRSFFRSFSCYLEEQFAERNLTIISLHLTRYLLGAIVPSQRTVLKDKIVDLV